MEKFMRTLVVLFTVLAVAVAITGPQAAQKAKQAEKKNQAVLDIGPSIDMGGGLLYYPMGTVPVVFDERDLGKPFNEIKNADTRRQLEAIARMYEPIGSVENARAIAESKVTSLFPTGFPEEIKKKAVDGFVADYTEMASSGFNLSLRTPMYTDDGGCNIGDICPGVCGTRMPDGPWCFLNYPCINCGKTPK